MSSLVQFISGTSSNLNSVEVKIPPTCPTVGSFSLTQKLAPVDSVYPYPSMKGQHMATFMNYKTSPEIGALPVIILVTLPPKTALVLPNTNPSHRPLVY